MRFGTTLGSAGQDRSTWLVLLFLLLGVVAPTACVLWFMNDAATSQAESARQSVTEAYRGQLRLIRDRVDSYWETRATALAEQAGTPEDFSRMVKGGLADSLVYLHADGSPAYPSTAQAPSADPAADRTDWRIAQTLEEREHNIPGAIGAYAGIARLEPEASLAARAAQAHIRNLLRFGNRDAATAAILEYFAGGRLASATDLQGRIIAADEHLLALRLLARGDGRRPAVLQRLIGFLNDYRFPIPSVQRLFLMDEVLATGVKPETFPTYAAERLAAQLLEAEPVRPGAGLESTRVPDLWKLTAKGGRMVLLLRSASVMNSMRTWLKEPGFEVFPPAIKPRNEAIAAGPMLPGWQVAFTSQNDRLMEAASRRRTAYLWVGYVVVASMIIAGLLLGQTLRRQFRLARLKTDLVAAVSHELKTPLASMRLLVDSLLEDAELDPQKTRDYLALVAGENLRLTRLIENFLTFSRIERNRQRFEFTEAQPASIVQSAAGAVQERFQQAGCHFVVAADSSLPPIQADADALATVLVNLLDNAYKYTSGEKHIALRAFYESGSVVFAVADNGIGIPPREHKRIFRKFYQVDQRLARETGGCGLGLSIVDHIVRAHGGHVGVKSQPGEGSTFSVSLPSRRSDGRAAA